MYTILVHYFQSSDSWSYERFFNAVDAFLKSAKKDASFNKVRRPRRHFKMQKENRAPANKISHTTQRAKKQNKKIRLERFGSQWWRVTKSEYTLLHVIIDEN